MRQYCDRCSRYFVNGDAYHRHIRDSNSHWICNDCNIDFPSWLQLKEHYVQSPKHAYCQYCDEHFYDDDDLKEHYEDAHHYCRACNKVFKNEHGLKEHLRQSPYHNYCVECDRNFSSPNALRNHRNSSIHQPKNVQCPFHSCYESFVSISALILHLESGRCSSGINRADVNKIVKFHDRHGYITDPSRMLTYGDEETTITYQATSATWNGYSYECYLCHNTFNTLAGLNQHLASPRHQQKIYFCPKDDCRIRFTALSGLFQHIESGRCGVNRFERVQRLMDAVPRRMAIQAW